MTRLGVLALLVLAGLAAGAGRVGATNECKGLQVCVRVAGPWVVVPSGLGSPRAPVLYQLSCPKGFVVGGLDAELSDRAIDIDFSGLVGSPVNPGVTTARAALFRAVYTGTAPRAPTFRPHAGCIPTAGGGSGPVPYRVLAAFPPGQPTVRRVRTVRVHQGALHVVSACAAGERLLSGWHAIGFSTASPPSADQIRLISTTQQLRGNRVEVRARVAPLLVVRALIQVGAVCGGGS